MSEINIESVTNKFEHHIFNDFNHRILFSGKFGTGKTFFLNKYFDTNHSQFNKVYISPIDYVVSSNEDIFELIKADILKELFLTDKVLLSKVPDDTKVQKIAKYFEDNPLVLPRFMARMLTKISPITETPIAILDAIAKLIESGKDQIKSKKEFISIEKDTQVFLDESENKLGSIYEYNYITRVINTFLKDIRKEKKNVLIIDDLDRIDPDHIFRILNVFSAHNNQPNQRNKFDFDHVIIVCDIENIKKIFFHKYGNEVDFDGYIDKFYSTDIFFFNNIDAIRVYIKEVFNSNRENSDSTDFICTILTHLVDANYISIRKLIKHNNDIYFPTFQIYEQAGFDQGVFLRQFPPFIKNNDKLFVTSDDLPILRFFKLMSVLFGDFKIFQEALNNLMTKSYEHDYWEVREVVKFLSLQHHIASKTGMELFFSQENQMLYPPNTKFENRIFSMNLGWDYNNKYNGKISYFLNAKLNDPANLTLVDGKSGIKINSNSFYKYIISIAEFCERRKLLEKAFIAY